jgi:hypothetical protein
MCAAARRRCASAGVAPTATTNAAENTMLAGSRPIDSQHAITRLRWATKSSRGRNVALVVAVGATPAEAQRRRAAAHIDPAGNDPLGIIGTIEQAAETLERWRMAGAERIYLQVLDLADLDHLDVISAAVAAG